MNDTSGGGRLAALDRVPPLPAWTLTAIVLIASAFAIRAWQFGNPVVHIDEQFYLLVGDRMLGGALPYVDIWDRKPIGIFLIYAAIRTLGGTGVVEYQMAATLFAGLTALLVALLAARFASRIAAAAAGLCYLLWLNILGGEGGQSPVFYNLPVAAAALLTLRAISRERFDSAAFAQGAAAMLLSGLAIQIKYTALAEGLFFGLALIWGARRAGLGWPRLLPAGLVWAALGAAPTLAAFLFYLRLGHGDAFVHANFLSALQRSSPGAAVLAGRIFFIAAMILPLILAAIAARWPKQEKRRGPRGWDFALAWAGAASAGLLFFGTYYEHYALALLPPFCAAAAPLMGDWRSGYGFTARARRLLVPAILFLPLFALVTQAFVIAKHRRERGRAEQVEQVVGFVRPRLRPGECIYVVEEDPILYHLTGSRLPTRWPFPDHLGKFMDSGAIGTDPVAEMRRILASRPRFVDVNHLRHPYSNPPVWRLIGGALRTDYRLAHRVRVGHRYRMIFERLEPAGSAR